MYKKIYRSMCVITLFALAVSSLVLLLVSFSLINSYTHASLREKAETAARFINAAVDEYSDDCGELSSILPSNTQFYNENGVAPDGTCADFEISDITEAGFVGNKGYALPVMGGLIFARAENGRLVGTFFLLGAVALFFCVLIYLLASWLASAITKNIVKPLEDTYSYEQDAVYDELEPFIARITSQGREIKRQEDKVKEQKLRLRAISENMSEGLIIVDNLTNILSLNKSVTELFEASEKNVKHKPFSALTDDKKLSAYLQRALRGEKLYTSMEKNGKAYQVFYSPVYEKDKITGVVILLIDVSERIKTEQIRREFSANVSHELKTPLTAIHGYSQIITGGLARDEDIIGFAEKIEKESLRMINLIDDIIKLSRLDEQAESLEKEPVFLPDLCRETASKLKIKADKRGILLEVSGCDSVVYANKVQLSEMLYNLCDNAIKYNKENGSVYIKTLQNGFSVSDTGIGISEEHLGRIFERFFRADKSHSKNIGGTGLGLSIVKHLALCNNAVIDVKSTLGKGSVFTVTFK